jgi:electron transfer flavoprotein beta subunit
MNIFVLMKRTFDTEEKVQIKNNAIVQDGVEYIINPYDEYAIEEAIRLRDEHGGEVTVLTVGPQEAEKELRTALAMGADKAILVDDAGLNADEHTIATILAAILKDKSYDLILGGNVSVDNGAGQVAVRVAELLEIPQVTTITKLELEGNKATVERDVEGDTEIIEVSLPALFTAQQGLNEPRYPSLPGIMKAKKKPLERITPADLGLSAEAIQAQTTVLSYQPPAAREAGRILEGELDQQVKDLVRLLREEAKVV